MSFRDTQNPGIGGLDELTTAEELVVQQLGALGDPNADRILFWDDSAGSFAYLTLGTNLTITGTTLDASASSGANTALSNLAAVAINTSLVSDTTNTDNLGSSTVLWATLFVTNIGATATRVTKGWFTDIESTNMPTVGGTSLSSTFAPIASPTFTGTVTVPAANFTVGASLPFSDSAGVLTLQNVDALDATTEATIEAAIDTLANLTSIQGRTVTLADAGANALFGWDDVAGAYENLTQAEARTILGLGTAAYVATDLADLNEATIEAAIDTLANLTSVQGHTVTLTGAFIRVGAHSLTLTTSGATDVTLPTTGTLATLAGAETLSNKTLTAPKFADLGFIADANGNELIVMDTVASAVNEIKVANAATGGNPEIAVQGGDANISLQLTPKGTGIVKGELKRFMVRLLDSATAITTGTSKGGDFRISNRAITVKAVGAYVDTAATGATLLTIDINEAGVSIISTKITLDASEKSSETAATPAVISDSAIAADAVITFDVDAVGNTTPGNGLTVWIDYVYA